MTEERWLTSLRFIRETEIDLQVGLESDECPLAEYERLVAELSQAGKVVAPIESPADPPAPAPATPPVTP